MKEQQDHPHAFRWFHVLFVLLNFSVFVGKATKKHREKKTGKITNKWKFVLSVSVSWAWEMVWHKKRKKITTKM